MNLQEVQEEGMDWIHLAQIMDKWQAVVHMAVKCRVP